MSRPVFDPGNGGDFAAQDVAELITALRLPAIESFGPDNPTLDGLPDYTSHPSPVPEPASRVSVARAVRDCALATLAALKALEDRTAACKAAAVDRLMAATTVEATALALDPWQSGVADTTAIAEIATTLCVAEGTAKALVHYSTELVTLHPRTLASLDAGVLSWRHACTIINETQTLAETPSMHRADIAEFETRLLAAAPGATAAGFASKARRMREGTHPETLITRVREAISTRSLALEPGKDGMSWLILHIPATAANGVFVNCTRTARAQQGTNEHRTLGQLRADTATALLLGHHLLVGSGNVAGQDTSTRGGGGWTENKIRQGSGTADSQPGGTYGGFRLVDVVPDWAHGPRDPMIGPLTEAADARAVAWASAPENICVSGTVCPDIPGKTEDDATENHADDADGANVAPDRKDDWSTGGGPGTVPRSPTHPTPRPRSSSPCRFWAC